jgi:hypothetical protein
MACFFFAQRKKAFFSEEKKQKTFVNLGPTLERACLM